MTAEQTDTNRPFLRVLKLAEKLYKAGYEKADVVAYVGNLANTLDDEPEAQFLSAAHIAGDILLSGFSWERSVEGPAFWSALYHDPPAPRAPDQRGTFLQMLRLAAKMHRAGMDHREAYNFLLALVQTDEEASYLRLLGTMPPASMLSMAFFWSATPGGRSYWREISLRLGALGVPA